MSKSLQIALGGSRVDFKDAKKALDEKLAEPLRKLPLDAPVDFWSVGLGWSDEKTSKLRLEDPVSADIRRRIFCKILTANARVLDAGCGDGMHLDWLTRNFPELDLRLFAFDLSEVALRRARERMKRYPMATFTNNPIEAIPYADELFDVVFCFSVLQCCLDPLKALSEMERILKTEGTLVIYKPRSKHFDPFLIPNIITLVAAGARRLFMRDRHRNIKERSIFASRSGKELEMFINTYLQKSNLRLSLRKPHITSFNMKFYERISPRLVPPLFKFSHYLSRLPFNYYKGGEFLIFQKTSCP